MTSTSAPAVSKTGRGPFAGLPREAAILSAVSFSVALGYGIVAPAIPALARQFGVSVAAAATVISAFALMRVVFALPAGRLVDRFGSRRGGCRLVAAVALGPAARPVTSPATASPRESLTVLAGALRSRAYRAVAAVNFADSFAVLGIRSAIIPLFVRDSLHRSAAWTGIGFLVFAALNAAALLPAGRAADTLAPSAMLGDLLSAQARQGGILVAFFQMAGDAGTVTGPVVAGLLVDGAITPNVTNA